MAIKQFEGIGILAFYSNGLCQGHLIKGTESPFRLAGQLLKDFKDPNYNDCMEPEDVYKVLIQSNEFSDKKGIELLLRRERNNDASGLVSADNEFSFTTNQFLSGKQALSLQQKYFKNDTIQDQDITICIGPVHFNDVIVEDS